MSGPEKKKKKNLFGHREAVVCGPEDTSAFSPSQVRCWPRSRVDLTLAACPETGP